MYFDIYYLCLADPWSEINRWLISKVSVVKCSLVFMIDSRVFYREGISEFGFVVV